MLSFHTWALLVLENARTKPFEVQNGLYKPYLHDARCELDSGEQWHMQALSAYVQCY